MPKLEVAVMYTTEKLSDVEFIYPEKIDLEDFISQSPLEPFSKEIIDFLNHLSSELYKRADIRLYPDIGTFAFFCRKSNILKQYQKYASSDAVRLGRGLVFHITPSNVPLNFAYSFVSGLLSGNINIIRVPTTLFKQTEIVCDVIRNIGEELEYKNITRRLLFVRYERSSFATSVFSSVCDVRVVWGGDRSIEEIRKNQIPPRSFDVTFADRYSICAINADEFIIGVDADKTIDGFYNDTFLFDQNACSSPHLIVWTGIVENINKAQEYFWSRLHKLVVQKYALQPIISIDKLTTFFNHSVNSGILHKVQMPDNLIWRIRIDELPKNIDDYRCSSGYFYEYQAKSLIELSGIVNRKYQTLSYYGYSKQYLTEIIKRIQPTGIDRIVPIGKTTDFSFTWDGFDLIKTLSRECDII